MIARTRDLIAKPITCLLICLTFCADGAARAESRPPEIRVSAHYAISMIGVSIGQMSWAIDIGTDFYRTSANGKASGPLSMLVNGEGRVATNGMLVRSAPENGVGAAWRLTPTFFSSNLTEDGEIAGLQMTFENGAVKTLRTDQPLRDSMRERIPVSEADRRNVADPLTAMLIATPPDEDALAPANCDHLLAIFDGQRRYNLILSFKRIDWLKIGSGHAAPVLVCAVELQPIAGYRAGSMLVKYVGGQRNMEIWFLPIPGTRLIVPVRVVMPTMIGTLEIVADRFDVAAPMPAVATEPRP
ncbi:MAG: DUF3108 domain-containing protein [Pseudolabrys sp.]|nr:DUF3108 domain-containing protein [Pseudolabrys sp.]